MTLELAAHNAIANDFYGTDSGDKVTDADEARVTAWRDDLEKGLQSERGPAKTPPNRFLPPPQTLHEDFAVALRRRYEVWKPAGAPSSHVLGELSDLLRSDLEHDEDSIWGVEPTGSGVALAELRNAFRKRRQDAATEAASIRMSQAAMILNMSEAELQAMAQARDLVLFRSHATEWLPVWQLQVLATNSAGLRGLIAAYPGSVQSLTRWVSLPNPVLDAESPLARLLDGDTESVIGAVPADPHDS